MDLCIGCEWNVGSVADWFSAVATLLALVFAISQTKRAQDEANRLRAAEVEAREIEQASKVWFWVAEYVDTRTSLQPPIPDVVHIRNGSAFPIYDVWLRGKVLGWTDSNMIGTRKWPTLPAEHTEPGGVITEFDTLQITFRDSGDRYWQRDAHGKLTRLGAKPAWQVEREKAGPAPKAAFPSAE
jgi:hypothetical protein